MKPTGPTNPLLMGLIEELKKKSVDQKVNIWEKLASDLSRPTRKRRIVNLSKINRYSKENETVVVPGKILSVGQLTKKLNVAAFNFSKEAEQKINQVGKTITIQQLIKDNPKGKKVRILG